MKLVERGYGRPRVAIVGGIHGDEPAGKEVVERLIQTLEVDGTGTAQLVVANERALAIGERYTETDLNRAFPGDPDSDRYEDVLATRLRDIIGGADAVLALHTSHSAPPPFAIYSDLTEPIRRTVTGLPVQYVVDSGSLRGTTMDSVVPHTVSVELGRQWSEGAIAFGHDASTAFLRAHGLLDDREPEFGAKRVVSGFQEVPKGGGEPHVYYSNFEEIPKGEVFARDDVYTHRVEEEGLVPILASERGYEDIFGIYGRFEGEIQPPETE
ncbi:MAG: putative deacylase [halophilic archaeon J07HX64]|jgi:Predicted deacylase|nr:MAG: putative deacylase [halophilic archaeon J07HX64]